MKHDDFSWDDIILEAPGDDVIEGSDDELSATDYASDDVDAVEAEPAEDDLEADDYTAEEGEEDVETDPEAEEDPADEDPLAEDELGGEEGDPADEDPLADDTGTEDVEADPTEEEVTSDVSTDKQNINLVNDFIELYTRMGEIMEQLSTNCKTNIRYNPNIITVRRNLTKLRETTYNYITTRFVKETYVSNLYQFNLIIQALNVNIDLLSSVIDSNRKFNEKEDKKPTKKRNKK